MYEDKALLSAPIIRHILRYVILLSLIISGEETIKANLSYDMTRLNVQSTII